MTTRCRWISRRVSAALLFAVIGGSAVVVSRSSFGCILDITLGSANPSFSYLFPNWTNVFVTSFDLTYCDVSNCPSASEGDLVGLTIVNFGTASGGPTGDITDMYFYVFCTAWGTSSPNLQTMTYAGVWNVGGSLYPAWTWSASPPYVFAADPCDKNCTDNCLFTMNLIINVGPCPTEGATVQLGPNYNEFAGPVDAGGVIDQYGCSAPRDKFKDSITKTIVYTYKEVDKSAAAPGDTLTYTITYARPGTSPLVDIVVVDTLPTFTHYVPSSGVPAPDSGWAPEPGPPQRLKWTIPGPLPVTGGLTGIVVFKTTVDWGNGDDFEFGSGDVAAPEGSRVENDSQTFFGGSTCFQTNAVAPAVGTVVRRYLMWKVADNDLLFAPALGQPPDDTIFTIFVRNMSTTKTWWDVTIWDTVPAVLDSWSPGYGMDDRCVGWTMTPTSCSLGSPGRVVTGSDTLLTWRLDMPPGITLEIRWKAQVKPTATAGSTSISVVTIEALGKTRIVGGTGPSVKAKQFAHIALIALPTTYVSYVGYGGRWIEKPAPYFIAFFPLNKRTQFELRGLEYYGGGTFADLGGVSDSISCLIGDCYGGFNGSGIACPLEVIPGGGIAGCRAERIPAQYYREAVSTAPFNFLYKLVSNSPLCWQTLIDDDRNCADHMTFAPSTTMSYTGLIHYFWRRTETEDQVPGMGDSLVFANTGKNVHGVNDSDQTTTVHLFQFDYPSSSWAYRRSYEIDGESMAFDDHTYTLDEGPWRSISSDTQLTVVHGYNWHIATTCCCGCCSYNAMAIWPSRELGNVVIREGDTAYGPVTDATYMLPGDPKCVIGNVGIEDATYEIQRYVPNPGTRSSPGVPEGLKGTAGSWLPPVVRTTPSGLAALGNPAVYPRDGGEFKSGTTSMFRVRVVKGGPIQIIGNINVFTHWGGGGVLHASDPVGSQTGIEYWLHHTYNNEKNDRCDGDSTYAVDVFCPKTGMAVNAESETGMNATYTTTGPDQCVAFMRYTQETGTGKSNYRFRVLPNPSQGNVIAQYMQCAFEKGFTAPFLATGIHYVIIAPLIVFAGQSFWVTIVVVDATNTTKTDYCGTTSFTSTDSSALIEGTPMESYDFTWSNDVTPCNAGLDNGVRIFHNCTFQRTGVHTIVAMETENGSITGVAALTVVGVDLKVFKEPQLSVASSGDTVQFRICWSNFSSATAFDLTITDAVPMGTVLVGGINTDFICGVKSDVTVDVAYSTATTLTPPATFSPASPNVLGGDTGARWLRWTVKHGGIMATGCVCFRVSVK